MCICENCIDIVGHGATASMEYNKMTFLVNVIYKILIKRNVNDELEM